MMSSDIITVQVGQCGNQLGSRFFDTIARAHPDDATAFFRESENHKKKKWSPRCVMIDMEPKVIDSLLTGRRQADKIVSSSSTRKTYIPKPKPPQHIRSWGYDKRQFLSNQVGSGNNWAMGYNVHGAKFEAAAMDVVRREVESSDYVAGFSLVHSVAGGTGSGFGSRVAEKLRDEFPSKTLLGNVVWPYERADVIVQYYNTVLTLKKILPCLDGLVVFENEIFSDICSKMLNVQEPSARDVNDLIAQHMATYLMPCPSKDACFSDSLSQITGRVCTHPGLKVMTSKAIPQVPISSISYTSHSWQGLLKRLHQMAVVDSPLDLSLDKQMVRWTRRKKKSTHAEDTEVDLTVDNLRYPKMVASKLFLRGNNLPRGPLSTFNDPDLFCAWSNR